MNRVKITSKGYVYLDGETTDLRVFTPRRTHHFANTPTKECLCRIGMTVEMDGTTGSRVSEIIMVNAYDIPIEALHTTIIMKANKCYADFELEDDWAADFEKDDSGGEFIPF